MYLIQGELVTNQGSATTQPHDLTIYVTCPFVFNAWHIIVARLIFCCSMHDLMQLDVYKPVWMAAAVDLLKDSKIIIITQVKGSMGDQEFQLARGRSDGIRSSLLNGPYNEQAVYGFAKYSVHSQPTNIASYAFVKDIP